MTSPKIETPKVFISYSWGSSDYQARVLSLANDLVRDGIDVVIDKWSLKEGHDTYHFMEQSVSDPSITNVLILLDPIYAEKANSRVGGVGTETQIISPETYQKVDQEKFIPVVFERDDCGNVHKPSYLNSLLHFDLTNPDDYTTVYQRLVKRLFGIQTFVKPDIGSIPNWVTEDSKVSTQILVAFSGLKRTNMNEKEKNELFQSYLNELKKELVTFKEGDTRSTIQLEQFVQIFSESKGIRDRYLHLMNYVSYVVNGTDLIADMLESARNEIRRRNDLLNEVRECCLHELFIYTIAVFYKNRDLTGLGNLLGRTYFRENGYDMIATNYNIFYSDSHNMDNAVNARDSQKYYSGTAHYWIENINLDSCAKEEFVFADLLCYNYALFGKDYLYDWKWFPKTYIYGGKGNTLFKMFATKLQSLDQLTKVSQFFGYDSVQEFKNKFSIVEEDFVTGKSDVYRYPGEFNSAPHLCHFVKSKDLGMRR